MACRNRGGECTSSASPPPCWPKVEFLSRGHAAEERYRSNAVTNADGTVSKRERHESLSSETFWKNIEQTYRYFKSSGINPDQRHLVLNIGGILAEEETQPHRAGSTPGPCA